MKVKVSVVQPASYKGKEEFKNVDCALSYIDQAAQQGSKIVCFPELYPGPASPKNEYKSLMALSNKAKEHELYIVESHLEEKSGRYTVTLQLIGPDGEIVGKYSRTTPAGSSYIYKDIDAWGFDYIACDDLPVFETEYGNIGLLVCSEVYVPELSRILTLKGAEIIFYPAGGLINELMSTWKIMVRARAIENIVYSAATQNIYGVEDGVAMIAGPEGVLAEDTGECVLTAELDLNRLRWLREQEERIEIPKKYKVIPGTLGWRRPKMYRKNYRDW